MIADGDHELAKRACAGDRQAFELLVTRHYDFMYRIAYRWCGNRADAEDITHNAFLKMAEYLRGFRFESSFRTWLGRLVMNAARDHGRQAHRRGTFTGAIPDERMESSDTESQTYAHELFRRVQKLPSEQRSALILVFGEGMTHKEAAEIEECPEGTMSWRIHEARHNLEYMMKTGKSHE